MNQLNKLNILITGGAGFVGSNLARALVESRARVTIVDALFPPYGGNEFNLKSIRKKIRFVQENILKRDVLKKLVLNQDIIFHLAAQTGRVISMKNPELDIRINCIGTLRLLETIRLYNRNAMMIYASSRGVIGSPIYFPVEENHPTNPLDIYGADKLLAEKYCSIYAKSYNVKVCVLRLNNVYGPRCQVRSNHYGTINLFIRYALERKVLPIYGNGQQRRDYIYVDDVVDALIAATGQKAIGECFFVGSGKEYSLRQVVAIIEQFMKSASHTFVPYPKDLEGIDFPRFYSSTEKIRRILGWKPTTSLPEGIRRTIRFYQKNLDQYI